jgi:hypothetical protein
MSDNSLGCSKPWVHSLLLRWFWLTTSSFDTFYPHFVIEEEETKPCVQHLNYDADQWLQEYVLPLRGILRIHIWELCEL